MDFSVLLKDLRDVAEKYQGKSTEPQVSTHAYVDMFTKILKRAQKATEKYDDQITVLWVALNQLASIYKDLTAGAARDQLCKFIFGMCAKTVLNIQWSQLDDDSKVKKNFSTTVEDVHKILSQLGFHKFQLILNLMESHWTHTVLSKIMSGEEEDTEDCLEYIQKEDPDILKLRIEIMMKENCEEFALNLCNWSLKHPALQNDLKIKEHQIFILYKHQEYGKMQEVCETIICHDGIKVMSHLAKMPSNQELCIRLAQVFLIQDWVKPERTCCTQELLKLWIHHQYLADKDEERFLDSIWTVAKVCRDTEQIGVLIDGVKKECGDMFIQLYSELCKFAINIDKGNMEREEVQNDKDEYNKRRLAMSKTCVRMAFMLKEYDFRISRICGLTAFSLDPTMDNLNLVNKLYWTIKNVSAASQNSKINIATLYEIERLLGQMRPEVLDPEYSWKQLIPVCKKYKMDCENDSNNILLKKGKNDNIPSQIPSFDGNMQVTPMTNMKHIVKSDKDVTKKIDTGQKRVRKPKEYENLPKDIQKAHLAKLLGQKNLSHEEIEKVLSKEFPRHVTQDFNDAPSLDVKELDKTINDLKKSIYLETQYRERIKNNLSSLQRCKKRNDAPGTKASGLQNQHVSRQEQFKHQLQLLHNTNASVQRQQSAPTGSKSHGPILHRQLSMGSPQPPNAHSHHQQQPMSPVFGGSPPPAHSMSPRMSSPTGFPMSPPGLRHHSASPNILNSRKSGAYSQINTSQNRSGTESLCNKIQNELQVSGQTKLMKNSKFNILRPPGNSKQECAKIAQQIAEMHERQRAEKLENARLQGQIDGVKAALNSRNIPSRSQISDLLSLTFQGNKGQKVADGQKSPVSNVHGTDMNQGKNYLKKKLERSSSVSSLQNFTSQESARRSSVSMQSPNSTSSSHSPRNQPSSSVSNQSHSTGRSPSMNNASVSRESDTGVLVPGEQGWDPSRGIMKQKYYFKTSSPKQKDGAVKGNSGDTPLTIKPVYSMIVPRELTNPNRKEELVKTVTNLMKKFPKGLQSQQKSVTSSPQTAVSSAREVKGQSQSQMSLNQQRFGTVSTTQQVHDGYSPKQGQGLQDGLSTQPIMSSNNLSIRPVGAVTVSSQSISQNFLEEGLLNLNTLAAASVSVLGHGTSQAQLVGSMQLPQPIQQQQQGFRTQVIESQQLFSPIQPVQQVSVPQVMQQPEAILATPLYTMPTPVISDPVMSPQITNIQPHVDLNLQQSVVQQIIALQNQPITINNTQPYVNVVSQQAPFQVATVGQVNLSGIADVMTTGMTPTMSGVMPQQLTGSIANNVMEGIAQSMTAGVTQPISRQSVWNQERNSAATSLQAAMRPIAPKHFLAAPEMSPAPKHFLAAPEMSPALVQQILSSLKKGDGRSNQSAKSKSQDGKQDGESGQQKQSPTENRGSKAVKDSVKTMIMNRNDKADSQSVNEAKLKILQLRRQFEHAQFPDVSNELQNDSVPSANSNHVTSPRKTGGLLERLMSEDPEMDTSMKSVQSVPSFFTLAKSDKNTPSLAASTDPQVPELVDLGAKEFQLDSILALDNESSITRDNTLPSNQITQENTAKDSLGRVNENSSPISQKGSNVKGNHGNILEIKDSHQSEIIKTAATLNFDKVGSASSQSRQDDKHQEISPPCQSTYLNANRLGKERENREVKTQQSNSDEIKLTDNLEQNIQSACLNCDLQFPSEQHLADHKKISNCEPKWQCTFCKMCFKCSEILKSHEKNYCLKAPSTMVKCCICSVYFKSHEQLKAHLNPKTCMPNNVSKGKAQVKEEIVCGVCELKFESINLIKEHIKTGCVKKDDMSSKQSNVIKYDFSVLFKCTKCNFMNLNENIVSKHVEKCKENNASAEMKEMYECNMCNETFFSKEDACRHVLRQCTKKKVTNSHRQIQDVNRKLKDASISKYNSGKSQIATESKIVISSAKEKMRNDRKAKDTCKERPMLPKEVSKTERKDILVQTAVINDHKIKDEYIQTQLGVRGKREEATKDIMGMVDGKNAEEPTLSNSLEITNMDNKTSISVEVTSNSPGSVKAVSNKDDDKSELETEIQKERRISAENRFLAEFNEIEKRKQSIRMKKQRELEKQKELLERKEREKEEEQQKRMNTHDQFEEENEIQTLTNEKHESDRNYFETEKEKYVNSILGTSTLEEKMKDQIEREKKVKKFQTDKVKDEPVLINFRHDRKSAKLQESRALLFNALEKVESANHENKKEDKKVTVTNMKKRKKANDEENENLPVEKRMLKANIEIRERKTRQRDSLILMKAEYGMKSKKRSPQDIRKMKGLRAKRLIKKKKYFIDEMEPIHREKYKKEVEQEDRNQSYSHAMRRNSQSKLKAEIRQKEIDSLSKESQKKVSNKFNAELEKGKTNFIKKEQLGDENSYQERTNQTKEVTNEVKYRRECKFCGIKNKRKSDQNRDIILHYVQTHKLGFRQANYRYFCNFCNKKFLSTQTVQVKEHVFQNHWEGVLRRVAQGKYNSKVEANSMSSKSFSPVQTRCSLRVSVKSPVKLNKRNKHLRALALRKKCAEKLRNIALAHKDLCIDIIDIDEESSVPCSSNHSTDSESVSREERIADVNAKISLLSQGKTDKTHDSQSESKNGRKIAPRLARQMVRGSGVKGTKTYQNEDPLKASDLDESSDSHVITRSRSSSVSSARSSLIASAKKRKAAIARSVNGSSKLKQNSTDKGDKLILTRSGRAIKRPDIDYDKLTESSGLGSGEDNSELEDTNIRKRKSTRIRRLSEKGKSFKGETSDTDESSGEEIKRRVTRHSLSKGQKGNDEVSKSQNSNDEKKKQSSRRNSLDKRPDDKMINKEAELRSLSKKSFDKRRERLVTAERIITRQSSKNEDESDSETESNYTDIEHAVKMLDVNRLKYTTLRSAESDSESTSEEYSGRDRTYRLRKRHLNKKYQESSEEEATNIKGRNRLEERDSDFGLSDEGIDRRDRERMDSWKREDRGKVGESYERTDDGSKSKRALAKTETQKVVLIGPEDDDDLNVDYGLSKITQERCLDFDVHEPGLDDPGVVSEDDAEYAGISDRDVENNDKYAEKISSKARTVMIHPEDEFAGLYSSSIESIEKTESVVSNEFVQSLKGDNAIKSSRFPSTVMDEDEFEFLKSNQSHDLLQRGEKKKQFDNSNETALKAAFDSEFVRYSEKTKLEVFTDSDSDIPEEGKEKLYTSTDQLVRRDSTEGKLQVTVQNLVEDVPILPPRDYLGTSNSNNHIKASDKSLEEIEILRNTERHKSAEKSKVKSSPLLKSARVVLEDISVVRKAFEKDSVEKKLIVECEASSCSVRIDRLSKEDIEKHSQRPRNTERENTEVKIILIEDSDDETGSRIFGKGIKTNVVDNHNKTDDIKVEHADEKQNETLIQDIVLDGSFIDQLLVNEYVTVSDVNQALSAGKDVSPNAASECVHIVVEEGSNNLLDDMLAVTANLEKSTKGNEENTNNVFIVVGTNIEDEEKKRPIDVNERRQETEDDVWIENAETYAEAPKESENVENAAYKYTIVKTDDVDISNFSLELLGKEFAAVSSSASQAEPVLDDADPKGTNNQKHDKSNEKAVDIQVVMEDKIILQKASVENESKKSITAADHGKLEAENNSNNSSKDAQTGLVHNEQNENNARTTQDKDLTKSYLNNIADLEDDENIDAGKQNHDVEVFQTDQRSEVETPTENKINHDNFGEKLAMLTSQVNEQRKDERENNVDIVNNEHSITYTVSAETVKNTSIQVCEGLDLQTELATVNTGETGHLEQTSEKKDGQNMAFCASEEFLSLPNSTNFSKQGDDNVFDSTEESYKFDSTEESSVLMQKPQKDEIGVESSQKKLSTEIDNNSPCHESPNNSIVPMKGAIEYVTGEESRSVDESAVENTDESAVENTTQFLDLSENELSSTNGEESDSGKVSSFDADTEHNEIMEELPVESLSKIECKNDSLLETASENICPVQTSETDHQNVEGGCLDEDFEIENDSEIDDSTLPPQKLDLEFEILEKTEIGHNSTERKESGESKENICAPFPDVVQEPSNIQYNESKENAFITINSVEDDKKKNEMNDNLQLPDTVSNKELVTYSVENFDVYSISSTNEKKNIDSINDSMMDSENQLARSKSSSENSAISSIMSEQEADWNLTETRPNTNEADTKLDMPSSDEQDDLLDSMTVAPEGSESSKSKIVDESDSASFMTNIEDADKILKNVVQNADRDTFEHTKEETVETLENESLLKNIKNDMQQEDLMMKHTSATSKVTDDSSVCNEMKSASGVLNNTEDMSNSSTATNLSLLALQSYSDPDGEEESDIETIDLEIRTDTEVEESSHSDKQQMLVSATPSCDDANVPNVVEDEGEINQNELIQKSKSSKISMTESDDIFETKLDAENVHLECTDIKETFNENEMEIFKEKTVMNEDETEHESACLETFSMPITNACSQPHVSFEDIEVEMVETSPIVQGSEGNAKDQVSNEHESDIDISPRIVDNDKDSASDFNNGELVDLGADTSNSKINTELYSNIIDIYTQKSFPVECQGIVINEESEKQSEEILRNRKEINEHIQHGKDLYQGNDTQQNIEKKEDFVKTTDVIPEKENDVSHEKEPSPIVQGSEDNDKVQGSNENVPENVTDIDISPRIMENDQESASDLNNEELVDLGEHTCNSKINTELDSNIIDIYTQKSFHVECPGIVINEASEKQSEEINEHIQHGKDLYQGNDTQQHIEKKEDLVKMTDVIPEKENNERKKNELSPQTFSPTDLEDITAVEKAEQNESFVEDENSSGITNLDIFQGNEPFTRKTDEQYFEKGSNIVIDENCSDNLIQPETLRSAIDETTRIESGDIETGGLDSVSSLEKTSKVMTIQETIEIELESEEQLKEEFEGIIDTVEGPEEAGSIVQAESLEPFGRNKNEEKDNKNLLFKVVRQTSVSSSSDISLISFPEYETEHSEESNDKKEIMVEKEYTDHAYSVVIDDKGNKEKKGTSQLETHHESLDNHGNISEVELYEEMSDVDLPDKLFGDTDKTKLVTASDAYSSSSSEETKENLIPENYNEKVQDYFSDTVYLQEGHLDECKTSNVNISTNEHRKDELLEETMTSQTTKEITLETNEPKNISVDRFVNVMEENLNETGSSMSDRFLDYKNKKEETSQDKSNMQELTVPEDSSAINTMASVSDISDKCLEKFEIENVALKKDDLNTCKREELETTGNARNDHEEDYEVKENVHLIETPLYAPNKTENFEEMYTVQEKVSSEKLTGKQTINDTAQTPIEQETKRQRLNSTEDIKEGNDSRSRNKELDISDEEDISGLDHIQTCNDMNNSLDNEIMSEKVKIQAESSQVASKEFGDVTGIKDLGQEEHENSKFETKQNQLTTEENLKNELTQESTESDEDDPTLDKWVKDIISKESEKKMEVFELPSPRRKGMIVGLTCLHKKPAVPFVESSKNPKKDGTAKKEICTLKQIEAKKEEMMVNKSKRSEESQREMVEVKIKEITKVEKCKDVGTSNSKSVQNQKDVSQDKSSARNTESKSHSLENVQSNIEKKETKVKSKDAAVPSAKAKILSKNMHKDVCGKSDSDKTLINISPAPVQMKRKSNDKIPGNHKNVKSGPNESSSQTENILEKKLKLNLPPQHGTSNKSEVVNEVVQREDETDEEFRRRTETVRSARRKSAVKPYESDFNFEENENSKGATGSKVTPSASFWPSETEKSLENFDTASLYSSSSSSSATGGVKDGRMNVIARCARDFGKDETVKPKTIHIPRSSAVPVFTCASPERTTVSAMAVKIVKTMGASVVKSVPSQVKYTRQQCSNPVIATQIKVLDKNILSNTTLPTRIIKVPSFKSLPKVSKSVTVTPSIDTTLKKLTKQGNISKEGPSQKTTEISMREKTKKHNEVQKSNKKTEASNIQTTDVTQEDFEPTDESLSNKVKALRALHKNEKPFKWENSPSPSKKLRSQTNKSTDNKSATVTSKKSTSREKELESNTDTRKTKEQSVNTTLSANKKELRGSLRKGTDERSKDDNYKKDGSEKKQRVPEGRKTRQKDSDDGKQSNVTIRTRSRSGSKDKTKCMAGTNANEQKQTVAVKNKKKIEEKQDTKHSVVETNANLKGEKTSAKTNKNNLKTETRNITVQSRKGPLKHEIEKDKVTKEPNPDTDDETNEREEAKTRMKKRKSEVEGFNETSAQEPATKVCKLDGTSSSPEKIEEQRCAREERNSISPTAGTDPCRPAVRQIIHKGRVFEIQRGCVTETDIQDFTTPSKSYVNETPGTSSEDHMKKRSRRIIDRRKRAHSPEELVFPKNKDKPREMGFQDINKYISQTLRDIKRQREGSSNSKWTVKQTKSNKDPFPYSFKKAYSKL